MTGTPQIALVPARGGTEFVIARHVFRSAVRWAATWGVVFGLFVVATVRAYQVAYPSAAARLTVARSLESFSLLLGLPRHAETIAGFTEWRVLVVIALIGAVWGVLTSTGLFRGDEENGRWELLLVGRTTRSRAAAEALAGIGGAIVVMFAVTAAITLAAGRIPGARFSTDGALFFALAMVSGAAMFAALGAVTSQLGATRGQAATMASLAVGVSYLVRMVADSSRSLDWLRWLSPIGWVQELHPLRDRQPLALLPIALLIAACAVATVVLAGRRDLGQAFFRERPVTGETSRLLANSFGLALRLVRPTALGWIAGVCVVGAIQGLVTRSASSLLADSPAIGSLLGRLGVRQASEAYLGVAFLTIALLIGVVAASQVAAIRDEEATGRLDNLLARPVRRLRWLAGRVAISAFVLVLCGALAGASTWVGAASQHTGVTLPTLLEAGLNAMVPSLFVLGAGVLLIGARPRLTSTGAYAIVGWSFIVLLVASLVTGQDWLRDSSIFSHMALVPAAKSDWAEAALVLLWGACAAVAGAWLFVRRDVEPA